MARIIIGGIIENGVSFVSKGKRDSQGFAESDLGVECHQQRSIAGP
jgi:hypothetical protein